MSDLERLAKPFAPKYVKKPPKGKFGTYVHHAVYNQKLLATLGPFDMEVENEIRGLAPEIKTENKTYPAIENALVGVWLRCTFTIDGRTVTITEAGDVESPAMKETDGARAKDAISDALKRCAMRIGCGLHLWSKNENEFDLYDILKEQGAERGPAESDWTPQIANRNLSKSQRVESAQAEPSAASDTSRSNLPAAAPPAEPSALIERFDVKTVMDETRRVIIERKKGERVPFKVEHLGDVPDDVLSEVSRRLQDRLPV